MIELTLLTPDREGEYRRFLQLNPRTLIYATLEFRDFLFSVTGGKPVYWLALRGSEICGVLPSFVKEQPDYGKIINSLPWYGSYGGCTLLSNDDEEARGALLNRFAEFGMASDVLSATLIESPFEHSWEEQDKAVLNPTVLDQRIGQITELPNVDESELEEALFAAFKKKTRNIVRKSLRQGFELVISDEDWAWRFLYNTHVENMESIGGKAKPWEHFVAMRRYFSPDLCKIYVAMLESKPVAAMLLLFFNQTVEYITPVIKHEFRTQQPLSFLIWHAMLHASIAGYMWWNWGGTWLSQDFLHHFKAGWGAADFPYTYFVKASEKSLTLFKTDMEKIQLQFPYYYLIPYSLIK